MAFNYNRALQVWAIPLLLVAFFAYLAAHSFLSVFETVLDALFLCFAVDLETNDGSSEKPYFMDPGFLVSNISSPVVMSFLLSLLLRAPSPSVEDSHTRETRPASFLVQSFYFHQGGGKPGFQTLDHFPIETPSRVVRLKWGLWALPQ